MFDYLRVRKLRCLGLHKTRPGYMRCAVCCDSAVKHRCDRSLVKQLRAAASEFMLFLLDESSRRYIVEHCRFSLGCFAALCSLLGDRVLWHLGFQGEKPLLSNFSRRRRSELPCRPTLQHALNRFFRSTIIMMWRNYNMDKLRVSLKPNRAFIMRYGKLLVGLRKSRMSGLSNLMNQIVISMNVYKNKNPEH